jgi:DNA-binding transcriptional LysR family regulator
VLLCEFQRANTELRVELSVFDTQSVVELVADRRLELGIVGAARRHRSVAFEPFFRDEVILACPPGHPFAGRAGRA